MSNINLEVNGHKFSCGPAEKALFMVDPNEALNSLTNRLALVMKAAAEEGVEPFSEESLTKYKAAYGAAWEKSWKNPFQVGNIVTRMLESVPVLEQIKANMDKINGAALEKPFSFFKTESAKAITENKASLLDAIKAGLEV